MNSCAGLIASAVFLSALVPVQDHRHPSKDVPLHEQFYSTWFMPDSPTEPCCNKMDCYPTIARFKDGQWWAERREDRKLIPVPWKKVEHNRDNPDGQSHLCAPPPGHRSDGVEVFCFALGGGI